MIYIFEMKDFINKNIDTRESERFISSLLRLVSKQRKDKVSSYHFYEDKIRSILTYLLLSYGLKSEYGIDEIQEFGYNSNGKPYLKDNPHIHFNLSHCNRAVACIISESEVGIDVQDEFSFETEILNYICSENEKKLYDKIEDKYKMINRLWVLKEAYTKCLGTGITTNLNKIDFSHNIFKQNFEIEDSLSKGNTYFLSIEEREGYFISSCRLESVG